ncbi:MAG TPA: hypothetical protein VN033_05345 [Vulgatibacter sp.]|nr:hypothetical protein [Vulgatibacter sp.]
MSRRIALLAFSCWAGLSACGGGVERDGAAAVQPGGSGGGGGGGSGGDGEGGTGGAGGSGSEGGAGGSAVGDVRRLTPRLAGIVDPLAAAGIRGKLYLTDDADVFHSLHRFYEVFPDEFDFVVFMTEVGYPPAVGVYTTVNREAMPSIGRKWKIADQRSPSRRVLGAISQKYGSAGPTLHEIAHHWAAWLSNDLGFSQGHWYYAGVNGILGGFDPETLFCEAPEGARPPCEPDFDGFTSYVVDDFGRFGNFVRYAPLELYLMGLVPPEEVPPTPILREVESNTELPDGRRRIRARSLSTVTIEDIIEHHGLRPLATAEERTLRVAFVLVTEEEPTEEQIETADGFVQVVSCEKPVDWTYCFGDATRGLASMKVDLPKP